MHASNEDRGFTLFELAIVLAIVSIVATMTCWGLSSLLPVIRLKSAVMDLKSNMQMARLNAIRHNAFVVSRFDVGNGAYTIFRDDGGGDITKAHNYIKDAGETVYKMVQLNSHINILRARFGVVENTFAFNSRGATDGLAGGIYLHDGNQNYRGVTISRIGKITIKSSKDGGKWYVSN